MNGCVIDDMYSCMTLSGDGDW